MATTRSLGPGQGERDQQHGFVRAWETVEPAEFFPGLRVRMLTGEGVTMSRVELDEGASVPEHAHPQEQLSCVISGSVRSRVGSDAEETRVGAGEVFYVPANVPHWSEALEATVVIEAFSPRRQDLLDQIIDERD